MHPSFHTHEALRGFNLAHGFFGREGGVSTGLYAGLNCGPGSKDDPANIAKNRTRAVRALGMEPSKLCTLYQIHSSDVLVVTEPFVGVPPQADALVTRTPGLTLGILTADCAPVLFADVQAGVVGAAHAGWKGAHGNIVARTVEAMETLGAHRENIAAVIGPCIAQASYEVGPEFIARFTPEEQAAFFVASNHEHHHRFDLSGYVARTARSAGLQRVAILVMDTASNPAHYFSYRRTTLNQEPDYGRQISAIGLI